MYLLSIQVIIISYDSHVGLSGQDTYAAFIDTLNSSPILVQTAPKKRL